MFILDAMQQCENGGHVFRIAKPAIRYFKSFDGKFYDAVSIEQDDFVADDWLSHGGVAQTQPTVETEPGR